MTVTINGTTGIAGVDGSAATPAVQGADTNTGVFYGTDIVAVSTGGTERMRVDASGNVGIGRVPAANFPLDISAAIGNIRLTSSTGTNYSQLQTVNGSGTARFGVEGSGGGNIVAGSSAYSAVVSQAGAYSLHLGTNNTVQATIDSSGNFSFNSGYGSAAVAYGCRAWVNFNGTGTVAIRGSGNVTSITDNGTGDYTINFTTAMVDVNYSGVFGCNDNGNTSVMTYKSSGTKSTTAFQVRTQSGVATVADNDMCMAAIFR